MSKFFSGTAVSPVHFVAGDLQQAKNSLERRAVQAVAQGSEPTKKFMSRWVGAILEASLKRRDVHRRISASSNSGRKWQ